MIDRSSHEKGCLILAFGAHPDDIELAAGGTLCRAVQSGHDAVAVDLTRGESATRGSVQDRDEESSAAAKILGLTARENLGLPDAALELTIESRRAVATLIRRYRPEIIIAPWVEDLHPDHGATGHIVRAAMFDARLASLALEGKPWFTEMLLHYPSRHYHQPTVVVDISEEYETKKRAWEAYRSQRGKTGENDFRPRGIIDPFTLSEVRDRHYGSLIGREYGEGFLSAAPLPLHCLSRLGADPRGRLS